VKRIASAAIIVLLLAMAIHLLPGSTTLSQEGGFIYERYGYPGYAVLLGYEGPGGAVDVPSQLGGLPVYGIGLRAFADRGDITSVSIPQCVPSSESRLLRMHRAGVLGGAFQRRLHRDWAFFGCASLTTITIPDSVVNMGAYTFGGCEMLTSVDIPDGITELRFDMFSGCSSLSTVEIPDSVTRIHGYAFAECRSLTSLKIPDNVTYIGDWAFSGCSSLRSLVIPDNVTGIGDQTFFGCSSLQNLDLGRGIEVIGQRAFAACRELKNIIIPLSVKEIGAGAFFHCTSLRTVVIGAGVETIGAGAFSECYSLRSMVFMGMEPPASIGEGWIDDTRDDLRGLAFPGSNFPEPGEQLEGLRMGENIDLYDQGDEGMSIWIWALIVVLLIVTASFILTLHRSRR
jgi:hypothetical protein